MSGVYLIGNPQACFWCEKPKPCGCPMEEEPKPVVTPFPAEYLQAHEWGWSTKQADEFHQYFDKWLYCDRINSKSGLIQKRKGVAFAVDPEHSQVKGTYDEMEQTADEDHCDGPVLPLSEAPPVVLDLQKLLSAKVTAISGYPRTVNYLSIIKYPDETTGINWHRHGEDNGIDTPVLIVSTGAERPFHLALQQKGWKYGKAVKSQKWERIAEHGSLIVMPASFNDTHLHAILTPTSGGKFERNNSCGVRISVNTKCLVKPRVFSIKSRKFPRFAKYVGRKYGQYQDTPYGNYIYTSNEDEFRLYAEKKWLDPAFRAQAIKDLRGKHLLCWCNQDGPERDPFCHARVWLDIVNRPEGGR